MDDPAWVCYEGPSKNPYTKEGMAWKIFDLLPNLISRDVDVFAPVSRYVGVSGERRRSTFRLCRQVATLFDSYRTPS